MSKFSIDTIVGNVIDNPLLEPSRFEVIITGPVEISRSMLFNCSQCDIPGHNIGSFEYSNIGPKRKIPNEELFDELSITFYNGHHLNEIATINKWLKMIGGDDSYRMAYYSDIVADININIYNLREELQGTVKFAEAYPVGVSDLELGFAAEAPSTITVNFAYHTYEFELNDN